MARKSPGPKRIQNLPRTQSGAISRAIDVQKKRADAERQGMVDARVRVYGIRESDARSQMAGYPIGRLCLASRWDSTGKTSLTPQQHDALVTFSRLRGRYLTAIGAAKQIATPPASDLVAIETVSWTLGIEDEDAIKADAAIRSRYADARSAIVNLSDGALRTVIRVACDEQEPAPGDITILSQAANLLIGLWSAKRRRAA